MSNNVTDPSPTNPTETLGQTEERLAGEIKQEVGDNDTMTLNTAIEATRIYVDTGLDPAVDAKFQAAFEAGKEIHAEALGAAEDDDEPGDDL